VGQRAYDPPVEHLHSTLFDGLGAVTSIGFAGFVGGYFGSFFVFLFTDRRIDPAEAASICLLGLA
jgi:hypothetical protein